MKAFAWYDVENNKRKNAMLSQILQQLGPNPWRNKIQYFDSIDSTNNYAKQIAANGAPSGTVIIAGSQTAGRGRLGRSFSSPAGLGLYFSVILRPHCRPTELMHLTCAAGVAACKAVETATGITPMIKWTNDLILGKRKLGGILTELSVDPATGMVAWVIIGIGINCCQNAQDFPEEIRNMACSLGLQQQDIPKMAAALVSAMSEMDETLLTGKDRILHCFKERCITIGSEISVVRGDTLKHGLAVDIDEDAGLIVRYPDGSRETVTSGEVSIRGMYGYL